MKIPEDTLVIVADGGGARMLRNVGDANYLILRQEKRLEPKNVDDDGPAGRMPPESRGEEIDEATFAKQLAHHLNARALKNEFSHAVLMADPQTLGQIRSSLHKETSDRLIAEINKNLSNAPLDAIEKALS